MERVATVQEIVWQRAQLHSTEGGDHREEQEHEDCLQISARVRNCYLKLTAISSTDEVTVGVCALGYARYQ